MLTIRDCSSCSFITDATRLGDAIHVSIAALKFERRFRPIGVCLSGAADVRAVNSQHDVAHAKQLSHHLKHFPHLIEREFALQLDSVERIAFRGQDQRPGILRWSGAKRGKRTIACEAVFQVTHFERVGRVPNDLTKVIDIGSVGQHVRNLESFATFGVGVTRHDDRDASTA